MPDKKKKKKNKKKVYKWNCAHRSIYIAFGWTKKLNILLKLKTKFFS